MADIRYYDVILKPIVTEKSMNAMGEKKYTFMVHPEANKSQIKEAVEKMFEEHGRKEQTSWNGSWKNCKEQESNRCSDRGQQRHRNLRRTLISSCSKYAHISAIRNERRTK